jgi:4-alpha-glucanotransferase
MLDDSLTRVAKAAGISDRFTDGLGQQRQVPPEVIAACLLGMGLDPASGTDALLREIARRRRTASLAVLVQGKPWRIAGIRAAEAGPCTIALETGGAAPATLSAGGQLTTASELVPGYHRLHLGGRALTLAVCPPRAWWPDWMQRGARRWGLAAQIYSLRGAEPHAYGNLKDLNELVDRLGDAGGEAVLINPLPAGFLAQPHRKSPYQASDRRFLHAAALDAGPEPDGGDLIDYATAVPARLAALRRRFDGLDAGENRLFAEWLAAQPADLHHFAAWEAGTLSASPTDADALFHAWLQFEANRQLAQCAATAQRHGMAIGLIRDLPVGPGQDGFEFISQEDAFARGIDIGAPPDALAADGQNWGIAGFNPLTLPELGYRPYLELLRANMRHAGALRIDHVMSLCRLFWIPRGSKSGAYVAYPFDDLVSLLCLESQRAKCLVIGEDLGTVPAGFRAKLRRRGILGTRVAQFERDSDGMYIAPSRYPYETLAQVSTHDMPPLRLWWNSTTQADRRSASLALHQRVPPTRLPMESPASGFRAAFLRFTWLLAATKSALTLFRVEDVALERRPINVPGTGDEHQNWSLRLQLTLADLLSTENSHRVWRAVAGMMHFARRREL